MHANQSLMVALSTLVCLVLSVGCDKQQPPPIASTVTHDHDHDHDHDNTTTIDADAAGLSVDDLVSIDEPDLPENLNDAVKQLVSLRDTIRDAFHDEDPDAAHGPLHDIGHLLGGIEQLVGEVEQDGDAERNKEHQKELAAAVEVLFESYTAVDETFHSDGGKEYSEVESDIDAAVKTLRDHTGSGKE